MFQRQNVPKPVNMVAAACLLGAVYNFFYFVLFVSTTPIAWIALGKVMLSIAAAIGLLKLRPGWRTFSLFISWLGVLVLPFYILATIFSADFVVFVTEISGVESVAVMLFAEIVGFAVLLFILICLMRPDVKRAFQSREQEAIAT